VVTTARPRESIARAEDQREARRMMTRRQFYVALVVLAASGLVGGGLSNWLLPGRAAWAQEQGAQEVRAERFVVVDEAGRERAELGFRDGDPGLKMYDSTGQLRLWLSLINGNPGLNLLTADDHPAADFFADEDGSALTLWDEGGDRIVFSAP